VRATRIVSVTLVSARVAAELSRAPRAPPVESRHPATMCTVSLAAAPLRGAGIEPLAHCAGTVKPGTESLAEATRSAVAFAFIAAESDAFDARASRAF
jgi:hypothetical protein